MRQFVHFGHETPVGVGVGPEFVEETPEADTGVVKILLDQLAELLLGAEIEGVGVDDAIDEGDFGPDDQAAAIAKGVFVIAVLIMGEADGVGADFIDELIVRVNVGVGDGPAFFIEFLVNAHAVEGIRVAVEDEASIGIEADGAQAERLVDLVEETIGLVEGDRRLIDIGIKAGIPKMGVEDKDGDGGLA